jgi:hypothetical protein
MQRFGLVAGLTLTLLCASVSLIETIAGGRIATAAVKPSRRQKAGAVRPDLIVIKNCRIMLIRQVTLASGRAGILEFVEPREGAVVKADQQVAGLESEVAQAALATAEIRAKDDVNVRYAVKAADLAKVEHEKALNANASVASGGLPIVPDIEVRRLKLKADGSVLQIRKAELEQQINRLTRDEAKAALKTYRIVAPFEGVVTRVFMSAGEAVQLGNPILEIVDTSEVRVEGFVAIGDLGRIKSGTPVTVQLDVPETDPRVNKLAFAGRVAFVDVSVEPVTNRVRVWAIVANPGNVLKAGLTATMHIKPPLGNSAATVSKKTSP